MSEEQAPKKTQMCQCFPKKKPKQPVKTMYDNWGSYEEEGVRFNLQCKKDGGKLTTTPDDFPELDTVWKGFQVGVGKNKGGRCLGWREGNAYKWWTYGDVDDRVRNIAAGLATLGLDRQDRVGIYAGTKPMWIVTALAIASRSYIMVPLYDTLGADSCNYIINHVEMTVLFVDTNAAAKKILAEAEETKTLKTIIIFDEPEDEVSDLAKEKGVTLMSVDKFTKAVDPKEDDKKDDGGESSEKDQDKTSEKSGAAKEDGDEEKEEGGEEAPKNDDDDKKQEEAKDDDDDKKQEEAKDDDVYDPPTGDDIFVIMFTSGTTGNPKGVVLKNKSMIADFVATEILFEGLDAHLQLTMDDVALMYLPLAHAYGIMIAAWYLYRGMGLGFFGGNILKLAEDAAILKPTFVPLVPRLMNRVYSAVMGELEKSKLKSNLFWRGYRKKKVNFEKGIYSNKTFWDKLVFKKIQAKLGGNVRMMSVGSAPISKDVLEFWRVVFGAVILEGYGQTECCAAATLALGPVGGNVGHPIPCCTIKLADVPDCGYEVSECGKGEVCIKGENVMVEYYKQPDKTEEALDADGWLHTGDIGEFLEDGSLKIVDRKKHIFKLAQGEYIAPEKIENIYAMCSKVAQVFVDGNSIESFTVAIVVPDPTVISTHATQKGVDEGELMKDDDFIKMVYDAMIAVGKENKLNSLEQVKNIYVTNEMFSVENGLITPTMKNKRPELRRVFKDQIDAMYQAGPLESGTGQTKSS